MVNFIPTEGGIEEQRITPRGRLENNFKIRVCLTGWIGIYVPKLSSSTLQQLISGLTNTTAGPAFSLPGSQDRKIGPIPPKERS